jgi:TonB family protein
MRRITIRLFIALLTFAIGTASYALFNGLRALWPEKTQQPTVSLSVKPPTAPPVYDSAVVLSSSCGCNHEGLTPLAPTRPLAPISGGVLNGKAISLPKPPYPAIAKTANASGTVVVQIIVGESGCVIYAHAVSGHPLLQAAAVAAARQACFSPTRLNGEPVKVSGVITYNFVL